MVRNIVGLLHEYASQLAQKCPWQGHFDLMGKRLNKKFTTFLPLGRYRFDAKIIDDDTKAYFRVITNYEIY